VLRCCAVAALVLGGQLAWVASSLVNHVICFKVSDRDVLDLSTDVSKKCSNVYAALVWYALTHSM
jgi:hypothetical protein